MDDKSVILIPKPDPGELGEVLMGLTSKFSINWLATKGLIGDT